MAELASEVIGLVNGSARTPLVSALILALIFKAVIPDLQSAARDERMPLPKAVQWAYWGFVIGTVSSLMFLAGLTLYRLFQ